MKYQEVEKENKRKQSTEPLFKILCVKYSAFSYRKLQKENEFFTINLD